MTPSSPKPRCALTYLQLCPTFSPAQPAPIHWHCSSKCFWLAYLTRTEVGLGATTLSGHSDTELGLEADLLGHRSALITRWLFLVPGRTGQVSRAPATWGAAFSSPTELTESMLLLVWFQCKGHYLQTQITWFVSLKHSCKNTFDNYHRVKGIILAGLMKNVISFSTGTFAARPSLPSPNLEGWISCSRWEQKFSACSSKLCQVPQRWVWFASWCHSGRSCRKSSHQAPVDLTHFSTATT